MDAESSRAMLRTTGSRPLWRFLLHHSVLPDSPRGGPFLGHSLRTSAGGQGPSVSTGRASDERRAKKKVFRFSCRSNEPILRSSGHPIIRSIPHVISSSFHPIPSINTKHPFIHHILKERRRDDPSFLLFGSSHPMTPLRERDQREEKR